MGTAIMQLTAGSDVTPSQLFLANKEGTTEENGVCQFDTLKCHYISLEYDTK